ncbi:MAG: molecular chaperone HtpG [Bacteroidetes bacterium]|nr:molecular chaperone HtpG [Bacteroidota bacterium]
MRKGKIDVKTENIFPIIKKFLYSDQEIFLRELVSNAIDATRKIQTLASAGDFKGKPGSETIHVKLDKKKKTITVSDHGIGMTADEINKFINQIAFSSAADFLEKYKDQSANIIGHFGLGFYSVFMVSEKVEIITRSYQEGAKAVKWVCHGTPEFTVEEVEKKTIGTDVVLHLDKESKEYLEESKINELLNKYCRFLPVKIAFGKQKDWKDGKEIATKKDNIINDTKPAWTRKPVDLKEEDYKKFYNDLYPMQEAPVFNIHLNVDYPFSLTGILYFPKIKNNIEMQKNKIQLFCNQVFVTDSVEGIVPEFLTLLHGVIDSPDIPLNVSRSFLQNDPNVKKISGHISKKVADQLNDIYKKERPEFEKKWDDLKLFIQYGMITDEKFYERAEKFALFKNTNGKYFTFKEYNDLIKENQTNKDKTLIYLYSTNTEEQFTFVEKANHKGYDVLSMDGQLDTHFLNHLEQKFTNARFVRVDSDVIDKLIQKEDTSESKLTAEQKSNLSPVIQSQIPKQDNFVVSFENLKEEEHPMTIVQSEFMRRMKDMSEMGGGMNMYGNLPDSYNLVVNSNHPLVIKIAEEMGSIVGENVSKINEKVKPLEDNKTKLEKDQEGKKDEEIKQEEKDRIEDLKKKIDELNDKKRKVLSEYGSKNKLVKQLIDLALLSNNMLKGEELSKFVKRSIDIM